MCRGHGVQFFGSLVGSAASLSDGHSIEFYTLGLHARHGVQLGDVRPYYHPSANGQPSQEDLEETCVGHLLKSVDSANDRDHVGSIVNCYLNSPEAKSRWERAITAVNKAKSRFDQKIYDRRKKMMIEPFWCTVTLDGTEYTLTRTELELFLKVEKRLKSFLEKEVSIEQGRDSINNKQNDKIIEFDKPLLLCDLYENARLRIRATMRRQFRLDPKETIIIFTKFSPEDINIGEIAQSTTKVIKGPCSARDCQSKDGIRGFSIPFGKDINCFVFDKKSDQK